MASMFKRTIFIILCLSLILNKIDAYRLINEHIDTQNSNDDELTSNNRINLRSVLWPKICFSTISKKTEQHHFNDQYQHDEHHRKHLNKRNARRCYPFDSA